MNIEEFMDITVEDLAQKQLEVLKNYGITILKDIIECLENDSYSTIGLMLAFSPKGDGNGQENHYINFSYKDGEELDIKQFVGKLQKLKKIIEKE